LLVSVTPEPIEGLQESGGKQMNAKLQNLILGIATGGLLLFGSGAALANNRVVDRREIRLDVREIRQDHRDIRRDYLTGRSYRHIRHDVRDLCADRHDLRQDRRDLRRDRSSW
jgi:hypothetical protein